MGIRNKVAARTHADRSTPAARMARLVLVNMRHAAPIIQRANELAVRIRIVNVWERGIGRGMMEEQFVEGRCVLGDNGEEIEGGSICNCEIENGAFNLIYF